MKGRPQRFGGLLSHHMPVALIDRRRPCGAQAFTIRPAVRQLRLILGLELATWEPAVAAGRQWRPAAVADSAGHPGGLAGTSGWHGNGRIHALDGSTGRSRPCISATAADSDADAAEWGRSAPIAAGSAAPAAGPGSRSTASAASNRTLAHTASCWTALIHAHQPLPPPPAPTTRKRHGNQDLSPRTPQHRAVTMTSPPNVGQSWSPHSPQSR
ncbi:hypothetical protein J2W56_005542 [Nocardia kruczakiae]|uniref:Uncharacterized protein n=1 Tax=Nocardia kruczakiae TaxID=261477 RepID=A0ABU1XMK1_9NOCA|nr:hypothetical protein [Nocardia kruczakiae]